LKDYFLTIFEKYLLFWKNYIFQSLLAALTIFIIFFILGSDQTVIIASIGASAFIVFAIPKANVALPHKLIGGHIIGLLCGILCSLIPEVSFFVSVTSYSLAIGLSTFLMVALDFEHPPAAGTALGVALTGFSLKAAIVLIATVIILATLHVFLRKHLKDLT